MADNIFNLPSEKVQNETKDVLQQIANTLGVTTDALNSAVNLANAAGNNANAKIIDVENRFQTLTTEQQQDAEIIDARQGELSLGANLTGVKSQLAQKAKQIDLENTNTEVAKKADLMYVNDTKRDKSIKLELEDMSAETLGAMSGSATFDLLSIPQDESVTYEKLQNGIDGLIKQGKNLLNKNDSDFKVGYTLLTNGNVSVNENYQTTGFIKVNPGDTVWLSIDGSRQTFYRVSEYNNNKEFIVDSTTTIQPNHTVQSGSYIRLTFSNLTHQEAQIEIGEGVTQFEPYGYNVNALNLDNLIKKEEKTYNKGYIFSFSHGNSTEGRSDICFVGDELWTWTPSLDDQSDHRTVTRYTIDIVNKKATQVGSFKHNFGHTNAISYRNETDSLIFGNGSADYELPNKIYLVENASDLKNHATVNFNDRVFVIDVDDQNWGSKLNVVWGDSNNGKYNICYCITDDNENIRKVLLGQGENQLENGTFIVGKTGLEFNGTYKVLEHYSQTNGDDVVQGAHYEPYKLYIGLGHSDLWYSINTLNEDGTITKEIVKEKFYGDDGVSQNWTMQGITIKDGFMYLVCGYKIFVYKI